MIDWNACAALFPGQGSQVIGMGADFARRFTIARDAFEQANDILGYDLARICWEGPSAELDTERPSRSPRSLSAAWRYGAS